jgi:hypothetical protein
MSEDSTRPTPKRIQRKRAKDYRLADVVTNPNGYRCVTRGTAFGNPYRVGAVYRDPFKIGNHTFEVTADNCLKLFSLYAQAMLHTKPRWLEPLKGKDLACFCKLCPSHADGLPLGLYCPNCAPCHADMLLRLANA